MKIFITGATGFVGAELVRQLRDTPHELRCLVRNQDAAQTAREAGAEIVVGDLTDKASLLEGMRGCDWVASIANLYEFWVPDRRAYIRVNVDGMRNLMEAALETEVSKVVHVSTMGVWGNADGPVSETTALGPKCVGGYTSSKRLGDEVAWALHKTRGLPLVMVYPGAIVGPNDPKAAGQYIRNYLEGAMPARVLTESTFPWVHVRDVAAGVIRALEIDDNVGERYLLVAENLTFGHINQLLTEISGVKPPRLWFPDWLTTLGAVFATGVANLVKKPPMLGMALDQIQLMKQGLEVDGSKATRELGLRYTPIRTALEEAVATSGVGAES
jgi:dihydroflavonol-4-reductase